MLFEENVVCEFTCASPKGHTRLAAHWPLRWETAWEAPVLCTMEELPQEGGARFLISRSRRRAPEGRRSSPPAPGGGSMARASDAGGPAAATRWRQAGYGNSRRRDLTFGPRAASASSSRDDRACAEIPNAAASIWSTVIAASTPDPRSAAAGSGASPGAARRANPPGS